MARLDGNFAVANFETACIRTSAYALPTSLLENVTRVLKKKNEECEKKDIKH